MPTGRTITFREAYGYDMPTLREMEEMARATRFTDAIEAMRDLVKCQRSGVRDDDVRSPLPDERL